MRYLLPFALCLTLAAQIPSKNFFKIAGSPSAPITMEIYTDFSCPHCREFYMDTLPSLIKDYVDTGKMRLIHRDFVLGNFPYSQTAAIYANAAGALGKYELVARQLFETQPEWAQNGNVDGEVAKVLTPAEMQKVRAMVKSGAGLDDTIRSDREMAERDNLHETPTIVVVARGKRDVISGAVPYPVLKSYLDQKLGK